MAYHASAVGAIALAGEARIGMACDIVYDSFIEIEDDRASSPLDENRISGMHAPSTRRPEIDSSRVDVGALTLSACPLITATVFPRRTLAGSMMGDGTAACLRPSGECEVTACAEHAGDIYGREMSTLPRR